MILNRIKQYRQNRWVQKYNVPPYNMDILNKLGETHKIHYYIEESGNYITDCYIIDGFLIKLNRFPKIITITEEDLNVLIEAIEDLLKQLKTIAINWGHDIT